MNIFIFCKKIYDRLQYEIEHFRLQLMTKYIYNKKCPIGRLKEIPQSDFCDLAVVTFNNSKVVEYQIRTLNKFFKFPYRYTIFDNSTDDSQSIVIKTIANKYKVGYIKLPKQDFLPKGTGSYSHAIACNYLFEKYIRNGGAKYFGLLDHDIFPIEPFDISKYLEKQFFYGIKHRFYIWPGLFFMRMDYLNDKKVDFRPTRRPPGDTGARNGKSLFKNIDFSKYELVEEDKICFDGYDDIFEYGYSYFKCGWIHCWNASNYMGKNNIEFKMNMIYNMLENKLNESN